MSSLIYTKEITVTHTGMVVARVLHKNGDCKGLEFFSSIFITNKTIEKDCEKAHKWANERILLCCRQEVFEDLL